MNFNNTYCLTSIHDKECKLEVWIPIPVAASIAKPILKDRCIDGHLTKYAAGNENAAREEMPSRWSSDGQMDGTPHLRWQYNWPLSFSEGPLCAKISFTFSLSQGKHQAPRDILDLELYLFQTTECVNSSDARFAGKFLSKFLRLVGHTSSAVQPNEKKIMIGTYIKTL